jgi:hypothetical protein
MEMAYIRGIKPGRNNPVKTEMSWQVMTPPVAIVFRPRAARWRLASLARRDGM